MLVSGYSLSGNLKYVLVRGYCTSGAAIATLFPYFQTFKYSSSGLVLGDIHFKSSAERILCLEFSLFTNHPPYPPRLGYHSNSALC